jgi:RNA polymerase sigma-70 factor (sigma-E family)
MDGGVTLASQVEFEQFINQHREAVLRAARLLTGDWHAGGDLAQESLIRLYLAWPRLRESTAAWAYLRQTMVRLHIRQQTRRWRTEVHTASVPDRAVAEQTPYDDELRSALAALPPRQRATLVWRFFLDLSVEDTATSMRCSVGTVKSQTAAALATLRSTLAKANTQKESGYERS